MAGGFQPTEQQIRSRYIGYYTAVAEIDREVGRLLRRLEEDGRLDNTIVIYTSDHGCSVGQNGFWGKGNSTRPLNMYEISTRVPLMIRAPGLVQAGQVSERCVDHYDTFRAISDWAGITLDESRNYAGASYAHLLDGSGRGAWDDTRYGEYGDLRMVRTRHHKFVKRYPDGPHDLFELDTDPAEQLNRAGWDEFAPVQDGLEQQLEEWYSRHQDSTSTGVRVKFQRTHNRSEAWRDGFRERRGLQVYGKWQEV